jgi:putative two-component system hydrogenase maturation factor HypX/HoxX
MKQERRARDEAGCPLAAYREAELAMMRRNFWGFDPSYHVARSNFIRKVAKSRTPAALAHHRAVRPLEPARL